MIKTYNCGELPLEEILQRGQDAINEQIEKAAADILNDVKTRKDEAVLFYTEKFDGAKLTSLRVSEQEIEAAYNSQSKEFISALINAKNNIYDFHTKQIRQSFITSENGGVILGQKITPIEKAGLYVPGGTASYPSSVLMNAIPAKIAGVSEIVMVTPPSKDGSINPAILAAAKIAGVTSIYKTGGAQAIGALAYGTQSIPKVDKIVGPGNAYVAAAKRRVYGIVDIDMIAGPSEILVLADSSSNPAFIAADMLSQAEHDKLASAVLICDSKALASEVASELEKQIPLLPRCDIARASIDNYGKIIVANNINEGVQIANEIAPEHLEICTDNPFELLNEIKNAGSIFLGKNVPEAVGDYYAGPNHTLPTGGTARFSSPLSVDDFIKKSGFIYYTDAALKSAKDDIISLATAEGLHAHAQSVAIRFGQNAPHIKTDTNGEVK